MDGEGRRPSGQPASAALDPPPEVEAGVGEEDDELLDDSFFAPPPPLSAVEEDPVDPEDAVSLAEEALRLSVR